MTVLDLLIICDILSKISKSEQKEFNEWLGNLTINEAGQVNQTYKEHYVQKYGEEEGLKIYENYINNRSDNLKNKKINQDNENKGV